MGVEKKITDLLTTFCRLFTEDKDKTVHNYFNLLFFHRGTGH